MEPQLEHLDRRIQLQRMRQLATTALAAYDLPPARLALLSHLFNTTFRVDTADGQRYVLHIYRSGLPTVESVGAELAWLAALRRDTDLEVPAPVPTRDGPLLTVAATPGLPAPHICTLLRWVEGRRVTRGLRPRHMELNGELMARLQNHAAQFGPPPGFARGRVDRVFTESRRMSDPFAPDVIAAAAALVAETLSADEAELVRRVIERVAAVEATLGEGPDAFGFMHADMHHYNLLFAHGTVRAIDFGDCGFGPRLYDFAVPLNELLGRADYPAFRAALLAGYRRGRPLSAEHEAYLDTFIALRRVQDGLWVLAARRHPFIGRDWAAQARAMMRPLPGFLAAGGRFPGPATRL